jgi:hypothetical protein
MEHARAAMESKTSRLNGFEVLVHLREEQRRNHAVHYADATIPNPVQTLRRVK